MLTKLKKTAKDALKTIGIEVPRAKKPQISPYALGYVSS